VSSGRPARDTRNGAGARVDKIHPPKSKGDAGRPHRCDVRCFTYSEHDARDCLYQKRKNSEKLMLVSSNVVGAMLAIAYGWGP